MWGLVQWKEQKNQEEGDPSSFNALLTWLIVWVLAEGRGKVWLTAKSECISS